MVLKFTRLISYDQCRLWTLFTVAKTYVKLNSDDSRRWDANAPATLDLAAVI